VGAAPAIHLAIEAPRSLRPGGDDRNRGAAAPQCRRLSASDGALSAIMAALLAIMAQPRARQNDSTADLWPTRHLTV